jgi:hypothetical protein
MEASNTAIITPIYKINLNEEEKVYMQVTSQNNQGFKKIFAAPYGLNLNFYKQNFPEWEFAFFSRKYFDSRFEYNKLMLSAEFYQNFIDHQYIVICQTDAVLLRDLKNIENLTYDYLGSTWDPNIRIIRMGKIKYRKSPIIGKIYSSYELKSGNGGLSIRKTSKMLEICYKLNMFPKSLQNLNEDIVISILAQEGLLINASEQESDNIFLESKLKYMETLSELKVWGVHGAKRYNDQIHNEIIRRDWSEYQAP